MRAQTVQNRYLLNAIVGETYVRSAFIYHADIAKQMGYPYGNTSFGAEFGLMNPNDPKEIYARANTSNNQLTWAEDGLMVWSFPSEETSRWHFDVAAFYLDIVVPTEAFDPKGTRITIDQGTIEVGSKSVDSSNASHDHRHHHRRLNNHSPHIHSPTHSHHYYDDGTYPSDWPFR
jgi:hypothetical protein